MRRTLFFILALLFLCTSCATRSPEKVSYTPEEEAEALRSALVQASVQIDPHIFSQIPLEEYLGPRAKAMAEHSEIPLIGDRLEEWKASMAELFTQTVIQSKQAIESYATHLVLDDTESLMRQDDGMSSLLERQMGLQWQKEIDRTLQPKLTELSRTLSSIATDYEIWARGKQATGSGSYPAITLPTVEDFSRFYLNRLLEELKHQEVDVRTTPRVLGTGSLYEFFSRRKS